jgi:hypothetical protein
MEYIPNTNVKTTKFGIFPQTKELCHEAYFHLFLMRVSPIPLNCRYKIAGCPCWERDALLGIFSYLSDGLF